jgi:hypothetical protein
MPPFSETLARYVPLLTTGSLVHERGRNPADLSWYVPQGLGLGAPLVFRRWDDLDQVARRGDYYGFGARTGDPIRDAPSAETSGGVVYFHDELAPADLDVLMRILGMRIDESDFVVVCASADDPPEARYLDQIRIIHRAAVDELFGFRLDPRPTWPGEPLTVGELAHLFLALQRERWYEPGYAYSPRLRGTLSGDGDWAKESLAFGMMVENTSWCVYRLWSRPWLVTK